MATACQPAPLPRVPPQLGAAAPSCKGGARHPSGSGQRDGGAVPCRAAVLGRSFPAGWVCWPTWGGSASPA